MGQHTEAPPLVWSSSSGVSGFRRLGGEPKPGIGVVIREGSEAGSYDEGTPNSFKVSPTPLLSIGADASTGYPDRGMKTFSRKAMAIYWAGAEL